MKAETWERANAQFLSDAVAWLRERLERYIAAMNGPAVKDESEAAGDAPHTEDATAKAKAKRGARKAAAAHDDALPVNHLPIDPGMDPPPALAILGNRFGLTAFELDVLLLSVAFELDTRIAGLCARAHDDALRAFPTFALALTLFDEATWDVTSLERPLRHWRLVEVERRPALPLTLSPLHSDARTVDFVKGFNRLDERLANLVLPIDTGAFEQLPASQDALVTRIVQAFGAHRKAQTQVQLIGPDAEGKRRIAAAAAAQLARNAWELRAAWLPPAPAEIDDIARLWDREALLWPTLLLLEADKLDDEREAEASRAAQRLLSRLSLDVLIVSRVALPGQGASSLALEVRPPTTSEQLEAWQRALDGVLGATVLAPQLAAQFSLDLPAIERIAASALSQSGDVPPAFRIWDECCLFLAPRLDSLAQRIDAKATWDDLVLPPEQDAQLHQIATHVRGRYTVYEEWGFAEKMSRGLGISALFAGDSGTGKTMAAEVIANELRLPLYRIDLSVVVSKYIGETEKNLRRLFDAADSGGFILFFDEADALFGKRSEVRDSHDRYANIEVNYLLQRIEAYRGLAILATNAKSALDSAFVRRLKFIVDFTHPSAADRRRIWERSMTSKAPFAGVDVDRLARINATGGMVHNAVLGAAFAGASDGTITTDLVLTSLRAEYKKSNRPINESDFRVLS
jgi:hypothetical protein